MKTRKRESWIWWVKLFQSILLLVFLFLWLFRVIQQERFSGLSIGFDDPIAYFFGGFNCFLRLLFIYIASCGHFTPHILYLISRAVIQSSIGFDNSIKYFNSGVPRSSSLSATKYSKTSDFFGAFIIYCIVFLYTQLLVVISPLATFSIWYWEPWCFNSSTKYIK